MWRPFCHPDELSATISSFNSALLLTTVWPSSLLPKRLFICTAEGYSVCCRNHSLSLLSPAVRRGFSQFVIAKVSPLWSAVYVLGFPCSQKLLCWVQSHTLESHSLLPHSSRGSKWGTRSSYENGQKSSYWFFRSPCHTYDHLCCTYSASICLFFFGVGCDWDVGFMVKVKFATFKVRSAFPVNY